MKTLTKAEEQVMQALWSLDNGGMLKDIVEAMPSPKAHHNTVATLLKILVEKKFVGIKNPSRYNHYYPLVKMDEYSNMTLSGLAKGYFEGSYQNVVSFLVDKKKLSVDDLELGIETIKRRSEGLLKFAETYRNLNKITTLNLKKIFVRDIFENLLQLMQPTLEQKNIEIETILKDPDLSLDADTNLLEQVLINLVVNAIEAVKEKDQPRIVLSAFLNNNNRKPVIKVADNGSGMPAEILEKIFIPFFSTKKSGSGIGLSLCKQIMMLHKGNIQVQSIDGEGTAFLLQF